MEILNHLPTVNMSDVFYCSRKGLSVAAKCHELHQACRKQGFFLIKEDLNVKEVFSEAALFFNLSEEKKSKYTATHSNQYLGYRRIGTETSVLTGRPEQCAQFKVGYFHDKKNHTTFLVQDYLRSYETIFKQHTLSYFNAMEEMASHILRAIANNFHLGQEYFQTYCHQPMHQMGLNYYPADNNHDLNCQEYAMSAHKDLCLITMIAQSKPGLMVEDREGNWGLIPYVPNTVLVMMGDYIQRWTHDYYLAPMHRVLQSSEDARISIIYKHRPDYETVIPVIKGINPEKINDTNVGYHTGKAYENKINRIMNDNEPY